MSGCYECGSEAGTSLQLCPECIEKHKAARSERIQNVGDEFRPKDDVFDVLIHSAWVQSAAALTLFTTIFVVLLFKGPYAAYGVSAAGGFALMVSAGIISFGLMVLFWSRMLVLSPMYALVSIFFPFVVYRYVYFNWEDRAVKIATGIHVATLCAAILGAQFLASALGIPMYEVLSGTDFKPWGLHP